MAVEFTMPKLGLTMEEGTILEWLVESGSTIAPGTAVIEIETDKVQTEVETSEGGVLHIIGRPGDSYKCGERIGWFLADGELPPSDSTIGTSAAVTQPTVAAPAPVPGRPVVQANGRIAASPLAKNRARERGVNLAAVVGSGPGGRIVVADVETAPVGVGAASLPRSDSQTSPSSQSLTANFTFAAVELARMVGLDLNAHPVVATSPDGRVSREDVASRVKQLLSSLGSESRRGPSRVAQSPQLPPPLPLPLQTPDKVLPLKGMRGTIASRMHASLQEMAQLTLMMDAEMDAVVADRDHRRAIARDKGGEAAVVPGYTDYVLAATARALRDHPRVNAQVTAEGVALLPRIHVGLAVALDEGLMVPVVHDADRMDLAAIAARTTELAAAARIGSLKLNDLEGGTFSVTALGMFGVDGFTPVINPPNVAILGVGRLRDDAAWDASGTLLRVKRLTLSLTWDHRAFDGAPAAEFVRTVCRYLDDPTTLQIL